jgi:hypothetical protein
VRHWSLTTVGVVVNLDQQITQPVDLSLQLGYVQVVAIIHYGPPADADVINEGPMVTGFV